MQADNEQELLRDYVASRSDGAFRHLVDRHINMVFGCALRRTGDASLAEEISQNVFTIFARKAHRLKAGTGLAGWLHKTTLFESTKALRGESRRKRKMKAFTEHNLIQKDCGDSRDAILPLVDEAIDELCDDDRRLILLHYFEGRSFREISRAVGKSEAASQKQASRALEKLGKLLRRRGVVASLSALGSVLAAESAKSAPVGIAAAISGGAVAGASSLTTSTLITNAIQTMTYAKTKTALLVAAAAAVPIGVQMSSISTLKEDLSNYEQREAEFEERGERIAKLERQIAALPAGVAAANPDPNNVLDPSSDRASGQLTALQKRPVGGGEGEGDARTRAGLIAAKVAARLGEELAGQKSSDKSPAEEYAEMMKNPAMRSLMKKQMEAQIAVSYGDFIDYLELDGDQRTEMSKLLLDRQMSSAEMAISNLEQGDGKVDPAGAAKITAAYAEYNAELKELLGEERFGEFDRFEKSTAERQELATFRGLLESEGGELPFETEQKLMAIMFEERTAHQSSSKNLIGGGLDPKSITGEAITGYFADYREVQEKIRNRVKGVLRGDQFDAFEKNQASHLKMMETSMKMQAKMFDREK